MPFTAKEFQSLPDHHKAIIRAVDFRLGEDAEPVQSLVDAGDDDGLEARFELLSECEGCVPDTYAEDDLYAAIIRKFNAIYGAAAMILNQEIDASPGPVNPWQAGVNAANPADLCVQPSYDGYVKTIIHTELFVLLEEHDKAWNIGFPGFAALAEYVETALQECRRTARAVKILA